MNLKVAYQGVPGAYSHIAAQNVYPDSEYVACETFAEAMNRVQSGEVDFAVIPVENSTAGRVSDVHFLLPKTGLSIVGEYCRYIISCWRSKVLSCKILKRQCRTRRPWLRVPSFGRARDCSRGKNRYRKVV